MNLRPLQRDLPLDPPHSHGAPRSRVFIRDHGCPLCRVDSAFGRCQRIDPFGVDPTLEVFAEVTRIEREGAIDAGVNPPLPGCGTAAAIAAVVAEKAREEAHLKAEFRRVVTDCMAEEVDMPHAIATGESPDLNYSSLVGTTLD